MDVEAKHNKLCIKKVLGCSIRRSYRFASEHWALFSLVLLLYLLNKSSPGLFAFVLSSSPVIICATLLLGILLSYGSTDLLEIDEDRRCTTDVSATKFGSFSRNIHFEAYQGFSVPAFKENTVSNKHWGIKSTSFGKVKADKCVELDVSVPLLKEVDQGDETVDGRDRLKEALTFVPSMITLHQEVVGMEEFMKGNHERGSKDPFPCEDKGDEHVNLFEHVHQKSRVDGKDTTLSLCSSSENDREDGEMVATANQDTGLTDSRSDEVREVSEDKTAEKLAGACRWGRAFSVRQRKKLPDLKIEAISTAVDNHLGSSLGSPFARVVSYDDSSCFDSGKAQSSSSDISLTDVAPVLDEIDPLLGEESLTPGPIANDDSGNDSKFCPQDSQIGSGSNDDADISKAENDGKDGVEKKDGGKELALLCTADDDKNVMDLGYSEVERSRRLEFLMAKRRSRKNIIFDLDRNMMDLDGNDCQCADRFSRFPVQVQPISVPRRNPFDLSANSDEAGIPGSAPSILHRRKNPFEFPSEQSNDSGVPAHDNLETGSHRDMFFRRHDSFNIGSQERRLSRFKPCFVLEAMDIEEGSTSNFQRQFSDRSVSKLTAVTEFDTVSSVADQEERNDLINKDFLRYFQRQFSDKSVSKLSIVTESDTNPSVADQEESNELINKDFLWYFQRQFSDKSVSKLSIVTESDTNPSVADQEESNELINKDFLWYFQRQFSDKSVSKLSIVTESDTNPSVADQEESNELINKDFLWYFQRQFSDKSVSKLSSVTESDTIPSVADQEDHNDLIKKDIHCGHASPHLLRQESDIGYVGIECSDVINPLDDETLNAVTSGTESEPVENTAT